MKRRDAKEIRFAEPDVRAQTPTLETRGPDLSREQLADREKRPGLYWPKERPRPTKFLRPVSPFVPCEKCDRIKTDFGTRAVVADRGMSKASGKAYLSCRCCGHRFTMALQVDGGEIPT